MSEEKHPLLLDHDADGIQEFDNDLPRWWVWLFYCTIVFAVVYLCYFHVFRVGALSGAEFQKEWKAGEQIKSAALAQFESALPTLTPSNDPMMLADGKELFLRNCSPCHRKDGGGLVGPNLCDDYWIHGSNFVDNLRTIYNGVPNKGMLTWKGVLNPHQIHAVASYIYTLRGTHPPNPKPPENLAQPAAPNVYE
jgi:cytochrome c oxidase cbb3-type subunit 3